MSEKKKTCILFGAGAEQSFGIIGGADFAKKVLGINEKDMNDAIKEYYQPNEENSLDTNPWYTSYTANKWNLRVLLDAALRKKHLDELLQLDESLQLKDKKSYDAQIKDELNILWPEDQKKKKLEELPPKNCHDINDMLDKHTSCMGILDGYFHTLISPKVLGPDNFWKVIACYTRAYLSIASQMVLESEEKPPFTKEKYLKKLNDPKGTMDEMRKFGLQESNYNDKNYYSILRRFSKSDGPLEIRVITTNYTPLIKEITELSDDNIAYVNGRFGLFESPYELQVYDVEKDNLPEELVFPYIFIQSGIKPIVDIKQLKEYAKMIKFLEETNRLAILGYSINMDDNHINSLIRSFLLAGKEVTFFDFNSKFSKEKILSKLRLKDNDNMKYKPITEKHSYEIFEKYLENIGKF